LLPGVDAVGDGKAERADMIGDDAEGHVYLLLLGVAGAAGLGQRGAVLLRRAVRSVFRCVLEDRAKDVGLVVRDLGVLEIGRGLSSPCMMLVTRSKPMPVSTCLAGSGVKVPSGLALYWMKT
jgi:hypothetical protein